MTYGPSNDNGVWRTRYIKEFYTLYDESDTLKSNKNRKSEVAETLLGCKNWIHAESLLFLTL